MDFFDFFTDMFSNGPGSNGRNIYRTSNNSTMFSNGPGVFPNMGNQNSGVSYPMKNFMFDPSKTATYTQPKSLALKPLQPVNSTFNGMRPLFSQNPAEVGIPPIQETVNGVVGNLPKNFSQQQPLTAAQMNAKALTTLNQGYGDGLAGGFGLFDWMNKGQDNFVMDGKGNILANPNAISRGDIMGGIGGLATTAMGAYGMFETLDQGQQQIDLMGRKVGLLESKYRDDVEYRNNLIAQNRRNSNM